MKLINIAKTYLIILPLFYYIQNGLESAEVTSHTPVRGCEIYIDVSSSMRWYFTTKEDGPPTSIQRFLQINLEQIINEDKLGPIYLSAFGDTVPKPELVQSNTGVGERFLFNSYNEQKGLFSSKGTNLVEVFGNEQFGDHFISIVVTDNIHSAKDGSNMIQVRDPLIGLAGKGFHIYLIGMKSSFNGIIDPQLTGQTTRVWYRGLRPVYIWIATRSKPVGDFLTGRIMTSLKKNMYREFVSDAHGREQEVAEGSLYDNIHFVSLTNVKKIDITNDFIVNNATSNINDYMITRKGDDVEVLLSHYVKNEVRIGIKKDYYDDLRKYWKVKLKIDSNVRWAHVREDEEEWELIINCNKIPKQATLKLKAIAVADDSKFWWRKWSTDDDSTIANGGKTLGLNKILKDFTDIKLYGNPYDLKTFNLEIAK